MKTKGFYNCLSLLKIHYKIPVNILGQKLLCINELLDILQSLCDLFFTVGTIQGFMNPVGHFCRKSLWLFQFRNLLCHRLDGVIDNRIYHMDGTAVYVQNNMITIVNILMNQNLYSLFLRAVCPISFTAKESPYNPGDHRGFAA